MSQLTRRRFARLCAASAAAALVPLGDDAAAATKRYRLTPRPALVPLLGPGAPETRIWGYNGRVPGPEIRVRAGASACASRSRTGSARRPLCTGTACASPTPWTACPT